MKAAIQVSVGMIGLALSITGCGLPINSASIPIKSNSGNHSSSSNFTSNAPSSTPSGTGSNTPTPIPTAPATVPSITCVPGANTISPHNGTGAGCYQVQRSSSDPDLINISAITPVSGTVCVIPVVMFSGIPVPISSTYQDGVMQSETTCLQITSTWTQLQFTSNYYNGMTRVPLQALIIVAQANWNSLNYDLANNSPLTHALPTATTFSFGNVN
jgi:hypothetical protein